MSDNIRTNYCPACKEQADRIAELEAENARLERSAAGWQADAKRYAENADYWKSENARLREALGEVIECDPGAYEARIARAALKEIDNG